MSEANTDGPKKATTKSTSSMSEAELRREVDALRSDLSALTKRFSKIGDAGVRTAKDYGRETYESGEAMYEDMTRRVTDLEREAIRSVREHPMQALGIAAGLGFLAALLTRR